MHPLTGVRAYGLATVASWCPRCVPHRQYNTQHRERQVTYNTTPYTPYTRTQPSPVEAKAGRKTVRTAPFSSVLGAGGPNTRAITGLNGVSVLRGGGTAESGHYGLARTGAAGASITRAHGVSVASSKGRSFSGDYGVAVSRDGEFSSVGRNGVAFATSLHTHLMGGKGSVLIWVEGDYNVAFTVGIDEDFNGDTLAPDTRYRYDTETGHVYPLF